MQLEQLLHKQLWPSIMKVILVVLLCLAQATAYAQVDLGPADTTICDGFTITLDAGAFGPDASYFWNVAGNDGQFLTVGIAGTYSVAVLDGQGNPVGNDEITINVQKVEVNLGGDGQICAGAGRTLDAGFPGSTYLWNTGATTQTIVATEEQQYSVQVETPEGCTGSGSAVVEVFDVGLDLGGDTYLCPDGELLDLVAQGGPDASYSWNTGETTSTITISQPGTYSVSVSFPGLSCVAFDQVTVGVAPEACDNKAQNINDIIIAQDPDIGSEAQLDDLWVESINDYGWVMGYYPVNGKNRIYVIQTDQYYRLATLRIIGDYDGRPRDLSNRGHVAINYSDAIGQNRGIVIPYDNANDIWLSERTGSVYLDGFVTGIGGDWVSSDVYLDDTRPDYGFIPWFIGLITLQDFLIYENYYRGWRKKIGNRGEPVAFSLAYYYNRESRLADILSDGTAVGYSHGSRIFGWLSNPTPLLRYRNQATDWKWRTANMLNGEYGVGEAVNHQLDVAGRYYHPINGQLGAFYSSVNCREFFGDYKIQEIVPNRSATTRKINDQGYVYGTYIRGADDFRAYTWRSCDCNPGTLIDPTDIVNLAYTDLNWKLRNGIDVNNRNYAVGIGIDENTGDEFAYRVKIPICDPCSESAPTFDYTTDQKVWNARDPINFNEFFTVSGVEAGAEITWYVEDRTTGIYNEVEDPTAYYFNLNGRDEWGNVKVRPSTRCAGGGVQFFNPFFLLIDVLDYGIYFLGDDFSMEKYSPNDTDGNPYYDPSKPTMLYIHGIARSSVPNHDRGMVLGKEATEIITAWSEKDWNVAVFYWNQFTDTESLIRKAEVIELSIYFDRPAGSVGLGWVHDIGSDPRFASDEASPVVAGPAALLQEAFNEITWGNIVRPVGHEVGGTLLLDAVLGMTGGGILRVSLLDPYYSASEDYQGIFNLRDNVIAAAGDGVIIDWYESEYINIENDVDVGFSAELLGATLVGLVKTAPAAPPVTGTPPPTTTPGPIGGPATLIIIADIIFNWLGDAILNNRINGAATDIKEQVTFAKLRVPISDPAEDRLGSVRWYLQSFRGDRDLQAPQMVVTAPLVDRQNGTYNGVIVINNNQYAYNYAGMYGVDAKTCTERLVAFKGKTIMQLGGFQTIDVADDLFVFLLSEGQVSFDVIPEGFITFQTGLPTNRIQNDPCNSGPQLVMELFNTPATDDDFFSTYKYDFIHGRVKATGVSRGGMRITLKGSNLRFADLRLINTITEPLASGTKKLQPFFKDQLSLQLAPNGKWTYFATGHKSPTPMTAVINGNVGTTQSVTKTVEITSDEVLYRGLRKNLTSVRYQDGLMGWATPRNWAQPNAITSAYAHNAGDNESVFTSWAFSPHVPSRFADGWFSEGLILKRRTIPRTDSYPSPDNVGEEERLYIGPIRDAKVSILTDN